MKDLKGKTAFVTGAASGIGRGLALVLAQEGCNLAIADLETKPLQEVRSELEKRGAKVLALTLDVSDRPAVYRAADETEHFFGKVHIVCNNAGIGLRDTPLDQIADADYDWAFGVNTFGVINGVKAFLPKIKKHGEGGHIVNTASMAGLHVMPGWHHGLYAATKMAVVALSEGFQEALAGSNIGVSVLCPAAVDSKIYRSGRVRPARFGGPYQAEPRPEAEAALKAGLSGEQVGLAVVRAIKDNEFWILTHPVGRDYVNRRHQRIMDAFDRNERVVQELGFDKPRA